MTCKTCTHFSTVPYNPTGSCRRFPPVVSPGGTWGWPVMTADLGCGEYQAAESAPSDLAALESAPHPTPKQTDEETT